MRMIATLLIALLFTFSGCKKNKMEFGNEYERSLRSWNTFKAAAGNNYRYTVTTSSWTGYNTETTLTVQDGKVVQRTYTAVRRDNASGQMVTVDAWEETASTLNTHQVDAGVRTLDEVYLLAKSDWLRQRSDVEYYFRAEINGIISTCGYRERSCADDCFRGITIKSVQAL